MSNMMVVKDCSKRDKCLEIREIIGDYSLLEWQRAELICTTCENCREREENNEN